MDKIILIGTPCWTQKYPFYALGVIAGLARDCGFSCVVHDMNINFYSYLSEEDKKNWDDNLVVQWAAESLPSALIKKHKHWIDEYLSSAVENPEIGLVCFSVNTYTRYFSCYAAAFIKAKRPNLPIMFGGVDCFMGEHNKNFLTDGNCDIICQGEAEICFREFLEEFKITGDYRTGVKGFAYFSKDETMVDNGEPNLPKLRDGNIPMPDYSQLDFSKYTNVGSVPIFSSRGCINRCNFCSESPNFKYYRFRKAEDIFKELRHAYSYVANMKVVPTFHFADSLINGNIKELERFCDLILESGLVIKWGGQAAIRPQMTTTLLEKMARSGFTSFFWGMESASDNVLRLMNKSNDIALFERILEDCNKLGIANNTPIIVGYPGEMPKDVAITLNFILKNKKRTRFTAPGLALARRKSPLYEQHSKFGIKDAREYDWETVDGKNTIQIRVFRRFLFFQACFNASFCLDSLVDYEEIAPLDMNAAAVAEDYISILSELAHMTGKYEVFKSGLRSISGMTDVASEADGGGKYELSVLSNKFGHKIKAMKALSQLTRWFTGGTKKSSLTNTSLESEDLVEALKIYFKLDKNTNQGRRAVYKLALDLFKTVYEEYGTGA
jgi:anaerobic magnesium-protoporphyrin IX monomethyl ester cyclase